MSGDFRTADLEQLFTQTRETLESMRPSWPEPAGGDVPPGEDAGRRVTGQSCEGQVRAVMVDGRMESLWVDPEMKRLPKGLCDHIVAAVNAALDARAAGDGGPVTGIVDPTALAEQLNRVQDESLRQMSVFQQAMSAVVAGLDRSSRR